MSAGARRAHGFTLIELLVVLALLALATASVVLALRDPAHDRLAREAERLVALLESARAESRVSGTAVRWRPLRAEDARQPQFQFEGLGAGHGLPQRWAEVEPQVVIDGGASALLLGPEPLLPRQGLTLQDGPARLRVASDGLAPFAVGAASAP